MEWKEKALELFKLQFALFILAPCIYEDYCEVLRFRMFSIVSRHLHVFMGIYYYLPTLIDPTLA